MTLYYIALFILAMRTFSFGFTWAFINGSYELLGNFIAEAFMLYVFILLFKKAKNGEIYKRHLEEYSKQISNFGIDKSDTI